jgi:hypothetical protein
MQQTVREGPDTLPYGLYLYKVRGVRGETWFERQVVDRYLGDVSRSIESLPSGRSKKGAHVQRKRSRPWQAGSKKQRQ